MSAVLGRGLDRVLVSSHSYFLAVIGNNLPRNALQKTPASKMLSVRFMLKRNRIVFLYIRAWGCTRQVPLMSENSDQMLENTTARLK